MKTEQDCSLERGIFSATITSRLQNRVDPFFSAMLFIALTILKAGHIKQSGKIQLGLGTFANSVQGYNPLVFQL